MPVVALLSVDPVSALFAGGIVVLVVSTIVMVLEMTPGRHHGRRDGRASGSSIATRAHRRRGRAPRLDGGVALSPDAAQVLSAARQRAGAKQHEAVGAPVEQLAMLAPVATASTGGPARSRPMAELAPAPIALGSITHQPATGQPVAPEPVTPEPVTPEPLRHEPVGHRPVTPDAVMELLRELAERDPERLVEIIQQWLRSDRPTYLEEDE